MARLDARWDNFWFRGQTWYGFDLDGLPTVPVASDLVLQWSVREVVASQAELLWQVREGVADDLTESWQIGNLVGVGLPVDWEIRDLAGVALDLLWEMREVVIGPLDIAWRVQETVGDVASLSWQVMDKAGDSVGLQWQVHDLAASSKVHRWVINAIVGNQLPISWSSEALASALFDLLILDDAQRVKADWLATVSGTSTEDISLVCPPGYSTVVFDAPAASIRGFYILSDREVTLIENAGDLTVNLHAGIPFWWFEGVWSNPFSVDITSLRFVNGGTSAAVVVGRFLLS